MEADLASGGMKPSTTSTKKPEKPQPTATRHSTSNGRGIVSRSGGRGLVSRSGGAAGWVSSRRVRGSKKERRVKQMSANVVSCDSARIDTIPMRRGAEVNKIGIFKGVGMFHGYSVHSSTWYLLLNLPRIFLDPLVLTRYRDQGGTVPGT